MPSTGDLGQFREHAEAPVLAPAPSVLSPGSDEEASDALPFPTQLILFCLRALSLLFGGQGG